MTYVNKRYWLLKLVDLNLIKSSFNQYFTILNPSIYGTSFKVSNTSTLAKKSSY